jgi:hypothetical protein
MNCGSGAFHGSCRWLLILQSFPGSARVRGPSAPAHARGGTACAPQPRPEPEAEAPYVTLSYEPAQSMTIGLDPSRASQAALAAVDPQRCSPDIPGSRWQRYCPHRSPRSAPWAQYARSTPNARSNCTASKARTTWSARGSKTPRRRHQQLPSAAMRESERLRVPSAPPEPVRYMYVNRFPVPRTAHGHQARSARNTAHSHPPPLVFPQLKRHLRRYPQRPGDTRIRPRIAHGTQPTVRVTAPFRAKSR